MLFICVRCVSFLLVVEGFYFLLPSAASYTSIHLICAHLSYMRIIKQLRRKVRKWAVCVNDRRMRKTLKNPRSTHRHTLAHNWAVKQKAIFYTIHREGVCMDSGKKEKYKFSFFFNKARRKMNLRVGSSGQLWNLVPLIKQNEREKKVDDEPTHPKKQGTHTHTQRENVPLMRFYNPSPCGISYISPVHR